MKRLCLVLALFVLAPTASAASAPMAYEVGREQFEGYYVSPAPSAPLVLLVHDWDGLTDYEVKRAEMLADLGYAVFAIDLFGKGVRPETTEAKREMTGALYKDRARMRVLLQGALAEAGARGAKVANAVAVGSCFGGAAVLELARSGTDLKGFVTFHGGLATPEGEDYSRTKGQLLVLHGSADTSVPVEQFASLARQLEAAGVAHEKSWKRFTSFLADSLR